jgi:hypothetical protein
MKRWATNMHLMINIIMWDDNCGGINENDKYHHTNTLNSLVNRKLAEKNNICKPIKYE